MNGEPLPQEHAGYFIVLEGIDGSGKTSVARFLHRELRKEMDVYLTSEPAMPYYVKRIKELQEQPVSVEVIQARALLFTADRAEHWLKIVDLLQKGTTVICDRFSMSTVAYQYAELSRLENPPAWMRRWLREINMAFPNPDLLLYLDSDPEKSLGRLAEKRKRSRFPRFENIEMLKQVRAVYLEEFRRYRGKKRKLQADRDMDELRRIALNELRGFIKERAASASI